jgi:hypothetical protein
MNGNRFYSGSAGKSIRKLRICPDMRVLSCDIRIRENLVPPGILTFPASLHEKCLLSYS